MNSRILRRAASASWHRMGGYCARVSQPAFHPRGAMQVLSAGQAIFAVRRVSPDGKERVLCLHNVTTHPQSVVPELWGETQARSYRELLTGHDLDPAQALALAPYQTLWLIPLF